MAILCFYDLSLPWKKIQIKNFASKFMMLTIRKYDLSNPFVLHMGLEISAKIFILQLKYIYFYIFDVFERLRAALNSGCHRSAVDNV